MRKTTTKLLALLLTTVMMLSMLPAVALAVGECEGTVAVTGVSLNKTTLALSTGASETLTATVEPADATNQAVTWTSNNAAVATVSDSVVTAVAEGTATITVTTVDGSKTATYTVTVTATSGFCGDPAVDEGNNVLWTLDSAGTLTISGVGSMADYPGNVYNATPWATERSNIKRIVIESGVTSIGNHAFSGCSAVEHIAISNTVTTVGDSAFRYCSSLRGIQLPDSITQMGAYVFQGCTNLKFANIPSSLTTVPVGMFYECSKLIDVLIPANVTVIMGNAFKDCPALTSVTIPEGVTEIEGDAFADCVGLKAIVLPTTMTKIDSAAFTNIKMSTWIYYNGTKEQLDAMITPATLDAQNFVTAYTKSQNAGRKVPPTSGNLGTMGKEADVKWTLDNGMLTITGSGRSASWVTAPWYALKNSIENIVVGDGITYLGGGFGDHYHLTEISLPDSLAFCPDGLVSNCCELTDITLPDGIKNVGISAFAGCDVLKSVALPETITAITNDAFRGCDALTDIYFGGTETEWTAVTVGTNNEPLANATVHYGTAPTPAEYDITVEGGTADPSKATAETVVTITAGTAPVGQEFDQWVVISGGVTLANAASATTTFAMPANAVSVKATYKTKAHVHSGGTASCTEKAKCEVCGVEYGELAAHDYSVPQHDGMQHWNKCANCDAIDTKAEHTGGEWLHDAEYHWKNCTVSGCGTINATKAAHAFGTDNICGICEYAKTPSVTTYTITFNGNGGTPSVGTMTTGTDGKLASLPTATRSGYTFNGWFTAASGGTKVTTDTVFANNTTIYAQWAKNSSGGSSGGGGSYTPSTYSTTVGTSKHGDVTISKKNASKGDTVTLTVNPDKGYTLETITVLDRNGKEIELTEKNGKYTFTMPASKVTIEATFMEDNTMLNYFVDVAPEAYYYDAVLWAAEKGITSGTDSVHFSPNASCSRAQVVTFLWRAAGSPVVIGGDMPFTDVTADTYYADAVRWAVSEGITGGTSATTFGSNAVCNRAQIVTLLYRANGLDTLSIKDNPFGDVAEGSYYYDAVLWAAENGITGGTSADTFNPSADCTRAQIVTFLYRYMGK